MSLSSHLALEAAKRFPRVSGDEPEVSGVGIRMLTFSPRERG